MKYLSLIFIVSLAVNLSSCKSCSKEANFTGNYNTPQAALDAYVWSINHSNCKRLEKSITGRLKKYFNRGKGKGCFYIINTYTKKSGDKTMNNINLKPTGEVKTLFKSKDKAIMSYPLHRKSKDLTIYFEFQKSGDQWKISMEHTEIPDWCKKCKTP